jgi:cation diffusion facilitator family transporter
MASESKTAVLAALSGNLAIAIAKGVASAFTGSSSMLTEALHSLVDTGNQLLLMLGMRRAARPPDANHPFGHGMEIYFWSFVVALLMFSAGGMASIYEGVQHVRAPEPIRRVWINWLVLGASALFEGASFAIALRQQRKRWPAVRLIAFLKHSKDPSLFAVLFEDSAALVGIALAALGIAGTTLFGIPQADGIASIAIGVLLIVVAVLMANEIRSLLTGEAAAPQVIAAVRDAIEADPRVSSVIEVLSMHLGPEEILLGITIDFRDDLHGEEIETTAQDLGDAVRRVEPRATRLFLRPGRRPDQPSDAGSAPMEAEAQPKA